MNAILFCSLLVVSANAGYRPASAGRQPALIAADVPKRGPVIVRATGIGRPPAHIRGVRGKLMARRAAEVVAVRNLAKEVNGRGRNLRTFRYVETRYLAGGRVEVTVETVLQR